MHQYDQPSPKYKKSTAPDRPKQISDEDEEEDGGENTL